MATETKMLPKSLLSHIMANSTGFSPKDIELVGENNNIWTIRYIPTGRVERFSEFRRPNQDGSFVVLDWMLIS